jgi:anti-anti-sigma factor
VLTITRSEGTIALEGRLDASQVPKAEEFFQTLDGDVTADLSGLEYISSAGLGVLLKLHKKLTDEGNSFTLARLSPRVKTVFTFAGLDRVFTIAD